MEKQMRVGVKYWNEKGEAMYIVKASKDGTLHASTKPKNHRPFSWNKASSIYYELIKDGLTAKIVYE